LQDLDIWERTQGGNAPSGGSGSAQSGVAKKDFDVQAWSKRHDNDFQKLIAEARKNRKSPAKIEAQEKRESRNDVDGNRDGQGQADALTRTEDVIMDSQESSTSLDSDEDAIAEARNEGDQAVELTSRDYEEAFLFALDKGISPRKKPMFSVSKDDDPASSSTAKAR